MQYNINSFIISNKQIQKKAKLFRQSVQLIERQVLSTDLRGYKGEFLIWSWGLKNKVFLSMNFMTNFGLTSNTKSCAIFNSECMLVFAACSPPFQRKSSQKAFSLRSTIASHEYPIAHWWSVRTQAYHTMYSWLIIVDMRQTKSMRVMNKALKIACLNYMSVWISQWS